MTEISASMVKELREKTGAGIVDAKNALTEAGGDMEKAAEVLRQKGVASADKKLGRAAAEGIIISKLFDEEAKEGILMELNCETDFVARGEVFQKFAEELASQLIASRAKKVDMFLAEKSQADPSKTVDEYIREKIGSIKENISLRRFVRYKIETPGFIHSYIHTGSKLGVLVEVETYSETSAHKTLLKDFAKDVAMHIASSAPEYVSREEIPSAVIEEEKRIEMGKEDLQSKPPEIREKIVVGRLDKILAQRVLLEQPFIKDPSKTVAELVKEVSDEAGTRVTINRFARYLLGEGVEKKQDNFAEEVMAQMQS